MANNSKISATNVFDGGLVTDLHVLSSPENTTSDALNMEIITVSGDQYIYQNIKGSLKAVDLPTIDGNKYIPLGVKVHNNVAYIMAGAFEENGDFINGMIGSFPSPDWDELNAGSGSSVLLPEFQPFHNYLQADSIDELYDDPFIAPEFNFVKNSHIDIEIQGDFDGSVNILFTDNINSAGIINSRFKKKGSTTIVEVAEREGGNDSNTYSKDDWDRIALVQNTNFPIQVDKFEVLEGGYLRGGGYRYFFKYVTQEGNTTEILYESPLIPIANGGLGLNKTQVSDKLTRFVLSNLDKSYTGIKVFFAHLDGEDKADMEVFKIDYTYRYNDINTVTITHTGLEGVSQVDASEIGATFTPIDTIKSMAIINDRLAIAGVSSTLKEADIAVLREASSKITMWEKHTTVTKDYSDPETAAKSLGYWKGEVYEFAAVYLLTNRGLSPAFPVMGMDNMAGVQSGAAYDNDKYPDVVLDADGFSPTDLINNRGIFRTSNLGDIYEPECEGPGTRHVTYFEAETGSINDVAGLSDLVSGYFIVRRQRIKNVLMQGMAVPTIKIPAKQPSVAEFGTSALSQSFIANKRYLLKHFYLDNPTLAFNAQFIAGTYDGKDIVSTDFDKVFVPQPTQLINTVTYSASFLVSGSLGHEVDSIEYTTAHDSKGVDTEKQYLGFYSCELEVNFKDISGQLNGINPFMEIQDLDNGKSPVGYASFGYASDSNPHPIFKRTQKLSMDTSSFITIPSAATTATLMDSGKSVYSNGRFTSKTVGAYGFLAANGESEEDDDDDTAVIEYGEPFFRYTVRHIDDKDILWGTARRGNDAGAGFQSGCDFHTYSLVNQSYSRYMGVEIDATKSPVATFMYLRDVSNDPTDFSPNAFLQCESPDPDITDAETLRSASGDHHLYVNIGHLANVFRSSTGRWSQDQIKDIYKFDSNKPYFTVTDRMQILRTDAVGNRINFLDVYRGDGFISKIFKRITYKNGVVKSKSATAADAGTFGIGINRKRGHEVKLEDLTDQEQSDEGRGLYNNGQVMEIVSFANINADIRSVEKVPEAEYALHGSNRDFYPNRKDLFGDSRPDSTKYNHGYTGDVTPLSYNRIEENSPIYNTEFPNRILLSERNKTQSFFNSFRDLKGFNYRDYGVELGPIIKLMNIKNLLLSVHPEGVLAIGVDDRTLVAEGSDVYVNTAESLSPKAVSISRIYGSSHPESIVQTDNTVAGVDYYSSAVWLFEGDKLRIISEFAIKTLLESMKDAIIAGKFLGEDDETVYNSRVYSTFNYSKHALTISYVAEHPDTKEQYHIGSVSFNTILDKWISRLSDGTKFSMSLGAYEYTTGFVDINGIWKQDSLVDTVGVPIRNRFRGIDYPYEFEVTIGSQPSVEKILDNIEMITNKSLPATIVYTTSGDVNDAAINVWGEKAKNKIIEQDIITRNNSTRNHLRLGILDENAYYKNSNLYIEVGKIDAVSRKALGNKRVRDKNIRMRFKYTGNDATFVKAIISILSISYS